MSLLSFVTGAASLFGASRGQSGSATQRSSTSTRGETAATASESRTGTGTSTQTSTGTSTTSGRTTSSGTTTGREQSTTTGTTTNYSSDVLASLDSILTQQMSGGGSAMQASDALASRLQQLQATAGQPAFDVNGYVSGITEAATAATQNDLDSRINSILSATGSSEGGNSMSALLGNKLRNDAAANLAGVASNARAQGEQIRMAQQQSITGQIGELAGGLATNLTNLLGAARGGQQSTTGSATASSTQSEVQSGTTTGTTSERGTTSGRTTESVDTEQSGITQTTEDSTTRTRGRTNTGRGDLFTNILEAFGNSSAAA